MSVLIRSMFTHARRLCYRFAAPLYDPQSGNISIKSPSCNILPSKRSLSTMTVSRSKIITVIMPMIFQICFILHTLTVKLQISNMSNLPILSFITHVKEIAIVIGLRVLLLGCVFCYWDACSVIGMRVLLLGCVFCYYCCILRCRRRKVALFQNALLTPNPIYFMKTQCIVQCNLLPNLNQHVENEALQSRVWNSNMGIRGKHMIFLKNHIFVLI